MKINVEQQIVDYQLDDDDKSYIIDRASKWWTNWYADCEGHRMQRKNISKSIVNNSMINQDVDAEDQSDERIILPQVWEQFHTYKAAVWKSNYSSLETMLDVSGLDPQSEKVAPIHKHQLINLAREMDLQLEFDSMLDNWLIEGEAIVMVYWYTDITQVRVPTMTPQPVIDETGQAVIDEMGQPHIEMQPDYQTQDSVAFDGPKVKIIDSNNFVFDNTRKDKWDSCIKIHRSYSTYHEIVSDEIYDLDEETDQYIYGLASTGSSVPSIEVGDDVDPKSKTSANDDKPIEVFEIWGDIPLPRNYDNVDKPLVLKNWLITIVGQGRIIRSEPNPYVKNPFVMGTYMEDDYGRGISPLSPCIPLNMIASDLINMQLSAIALIINKPFLAPKGAMNEGVSVYPGAIIEFDTKGLQNTFMPIPLDFKDALIPTDFMTLIESMQEGATGIYKYMKGSTDNRTRSATETDITAQSQGMRLGKEISMLNLKLDTKIFKKIAEVYANNTFSDRQMPTGQPQQPFVDVTQEVSNGAYRYFYGSRETAQEAEAKYKDVITTLGQFGNQPQILASVEWSILLEKWLNRKNIEFASEIIKPDMLNQVLAMFPPEAQQEVRDEAAKVLYGIQQQIQAANAQVQAQGGNGGQTGQGDPKNPSQATQAAQRQPQMVNGQQGGYNG